MRISAFLVLAAGIAGLSIATAQTDQPVAPPSGGNYYGGGYGGYGGYHASTAAEGRLRGMGDLTRSAGQANLSNSAAAIYYSIARRNQIDNRAALMDTYFQMRQANKSYRAAERGPRASMEDLVRYTQLGKPKPLSPGAVDPVSGAINWPILLRTESLAEDRAEVEAAFAKRASQSSLGTEDYMKIRQVTSQMASDLKKRIREVPSYEYMISKKFIDSLAYAAGTPSL